MLKIQKQPGFLAFLSTDSAQARKASTTGRLHGITAVDNDIKYVFSASLSAEKEK